MACAILLLSKGGTASPICALTLLKLPQNKNVSGNVCSRDRSLLVSLPLSRL